MGITRTALIGQLESMIDGSKAVKLEIRNFAQR